MAANKQIIFDIGNNKVVDPIKPVLEQQPNKPGPKSHLLKRSKTSNLGVRVSIKQITKSPIPIVLPSTQPNQPVIALGQQIPPAGVLGLGNTHQAPNFNPATKHPVVINNPTITNNTTYVPEQTHPAILPAHTTSKLPIRQAITHPTINNNQKTQTIKQQNPGEHQTLKRKQKTKKQSKKPKTLKTNTNHIFNI